MGEFYLTPTQIFFMYSFVVLLLLIAWSSYLGAIYYAYKNKLRAWLVVFLLTSIYVLSRYDLSFYDSLVKISSALFINGLVPLVILFFWIYYGSFEFSKKRYKFKNRRA